MPPRLKELYFKEIQPALKEKLGFKNTYMGPKVQKIVINMGLGLDGADAKIMKSTEEDLGKITGQKPTVTKFKNGDKVSIIESKPYSKNKKFEVMDGSKWYKCKLNY